MTANSLLEPQAVAATAPTPALADPGPPPANGRLVLAADGTHASDAAIRVGDLIARRDGADAVVLTVYEPLPTLGDPTTLTTESGAMDDALHAEFRRSVDEQIGRTSVGARGRPTLHERGHPARTIARVAGALGARLIVLGLGRHGAFDRVFGRETALEVARLADVPVLAVPSTAHTLPRRVLVAMDFGAPSKAAARAALALLGERGALYLVHVGPTPVLPGADIGAWDTSWQTRYDQDAESKLAEAARELAVPEGVHVELVLKHGNAARELLAFADAEEIDLVASGSHGHPALVRAFVGSVSTRLVRGAQCAVLVTPETGFVRPT
jgi:nucleotide-binding universal stress UspA family protein